MCAVNMCYPVWGVNSAVTSTALSSSATEGRSSLPDSGKVTITTSFISCMFTSDEAMKTRRSSPTDRRQQGVDRCYWLYNVVKDLVIRINDLLTIAKTHHSSEKGGNVQNYSSNTGNDCRASVTVYGAKWLLAVVNTDSIYCVLCLHWKNYRRHRYFVTELNCWGLNLFATN